MKQKHKSRHIFDIGQLGDANMQLSVNVQSKEVAELIDEIRENTHKIIFDKIVGLT